MVGVWRVFLLAGAGSTANSGRMSEYRWYCLVVYYLVVLFGSSVLFSTGGWLVWLLFWCDVMGVGDG